ncbi:glycosyltransferase family 4 protein [Pseudothauera nasutitermitis]|uniref:Glycosyltransferase family 4 protein n=1 Tax=Pseudothauera nasutitermitis TaxID=2565930 RepID=A0A4S4AUP2_9RHOO|nr:glycosyltransferase family 4 protein [Pseudothauera nasutitermitis]THF63656.1 glycosyltransferase family 4 protein [Pseudothauera nasutitermitis]
MNWHGLRVALVGPLPPPAGGMANQTRQLAELLRGEGAEVEVVAVNAPYRPAWLGGLRGVRALARLLPYLAALWRAYGRADVAHVMANSGWSWHLFAVPAVWLGVLRGVPVVVNYRGGEAAGFLAGAAPAVRFTLRRAAQLVLPSGFLLEVFGRHGMPGRVVPNIVDPQRFHPDAARRRDEQAPHLVVTRNLEAIYGIDTALRAFAEVRRRYPRARLSVAGEGPQGAELRALAAELGVADATCFTGRLEREQVAALYRDADLMVNPSNVDNMPNAVLEALASGVPVVSTAVGGVPWMVAHERTALLVPADDAQAMAQAVLRVLDDAALHRRLAEAGLAEAQRYRWEAVRGQWAAVYRAALRQYALAVGEE